VQIDGNKSDIWLIILNTSIKNYDAGVFDKFADFALLYISATDGSFFKYEL
jgi:hypothetical protein